jgi:hypothetical protein
MNGLQPGMCKPPPGVRENIIRNYETKQNFALAKIRLRIEMITCYKQATH